MTVATIVIPTYNRAGMVGDAVASALAQTAADVHVVVVDDGSTDETPAALARFASDPRVELVRQSNTGRSAARNHGLSVARGDVIGFLDSDDLLLPDAVAAHLAVLDAQPRVGMTVAGHRLIDDHGAVLGERKPWIVGGALDVAGWLFDCYGMPGAVMHRRAWLERTGLFDTAVETAEDWDLYLRLAAAGCPMAWVPRVTCLYRQHVGGSARDLDRHWRATRKVLDKTFGHPDLALNITPLRTRALAWNDLVFARKALHVGDESLAAARLTSALATSRSQVDVPPPIGRPEALEFLLTPTDGAPGGVDAAYRAAVQRAITAQPGEMRTALARTHIGAFFRAVAEGDWPVARRQLWAGLRRDPRWLLNRGLVKLGLRSMMPWRARALLHHDAGIAIAPGSSHR